MGVGAAAALSGADVAFQIHTVLEISVGWQVLEDIYICNLPKNDCDPFPTPLNAPLLTWLF